MKKIFLNIELTSRSVLIIIFFFPIIQGSAQEIFLKHFTIDNGLPSNEVYQVLEDSSGNLLVATDRGAVRFDGYSFEDIRVTNQQSTLPVYYQYRSSKDKIYFSSLKGMVYEYREGELKEYKFNNRIISLFSHPGLLIANAMAEKDDSLWISFNNDYNYNFRIGSCVVGPNGKVNLLNKPDGIYFDLERHFHFRQLSDTSVQRNNYPVYIKWKNGAESEGRVDINWRSGYIRRLYHFKCGGYDLFCIGRQLLIYKDGKKSGSHLFPGNVLTMLAVENGQFYAGIENGGCSLYRIDGSKISGPVETLLKELTVTCVYKDKQGGIWFSTLENGLFYSYPTPTYYWENENNIECVEARSGFTYAGYKSGKIRKFVSGELVAELNLPLKPEDRLIHFSFDQHDSLIAITAKGYFIQRKNDWHFVAGSDVILLPANGPAIYGAAGMYPIIHAYEKIGMEPVRHIVLPKRVISMFMDKQKNLWIGTLEGLYRYSDSALTDLTKLNTVFADRIVAIGELPGSGLVIASMANGLTVYDGTEMHNLNSLNGLVTPVINTMSIENGMIWIGSNKGLTRIRYKDGKFITQHFGIEAGLPTNDVSHFAVMNGWIYMKWVNKLVAISVSKLLQAELINNIRITSVLVNDNKVNSALQPVFNHSQNSIVFHFNSINLSSAIQQEYRYRLEGFDAKWSVTRARVVKYINLPPGHYEFKVQAISKGVVSNMSSYSFFIKKPFWQTTIFFIVVSVLLISLFILIAKILLYSEKKKNQLLLNLAESRQKALVQLISPHFIYNVLNTVQSAVLRQDKITAASIFARFGKLMRLSLELSKDKMVTLDKEIELISQYFELELIRTPDRFSYTIEPDKTVKPANTWIPSMLIQPFVENAIKHGVMHLSHRAGAIAIKFFRVNGELICTVDDNGIGRRESGIINKNIELEHESSGVLITVERLKLLHKQRKTRYFYGVRDKVGSNERSGGTTIIFSLPHTEVNNE